MEAIRGALIADPAAATVPPSPPLPRPGCSVRVVVRGLGGCRLVRLMPAFVQSLARLLASPAAAFILSSGVSHPVSPPPPPPSSVPRTPTPTAMDPNHMSYWLAHLAADGDGEGGGARLDLAWAGRSTAETEPLSAPGSRLAPLASSSTAASAPAPASASATASASTAAAAQDAAGEAQSTRSKSRKRRAPAAAAAAGCSAQPRPRSGGWREDMARQGLELEQYWARRSAQWCAASAAGSSTS